MQNKSLKLGGGTVEQVSLNVEINLEKILNLFLENIKFIKENFKKKVTDCSLTSNNLLF